jgi:hypothetical protein
MTPAVRAAFTAGWYHGALLGEASPREAVAAHPEYSAGELDAFTEGSVDGAVGDPWRRDFIPEEGGSRA